MQLFFEYSKKHVNRIVDLLLTNVQKKFVARIGDEPLNVLWLQVEHDPAIHPDQHRVIGHLYIILQVKIKIEKKKLF